MSNSNDGWTSCKACGAIAPVETNLCPECLLEAYEFADTVDDLDPYEAEDDFELFFNREGKNGREEADID